jgi:hypothetical protein
MKTFLSATFVMALFLVGITSSCSTLTGWLSEPAQGGPIVLEDPTTGTRVEVDLPEGVEPGPVTLEWPEGSGNAVTFYPAAAPEGQKTRADGIASFLTSVLGAASGNPLVTVLGGGVLSAVASRFRKPAVQTA